ncbi:MAG: manganese efflux pump [Clostridia bacterium]|nr:manganese efflux pump [Clostridia bacterium]
MGLWEVVLTAVALAMDACAVSMTNGMTDRKMPVRRVLLIGLAFGLFQFMMPVIGYFVTHLIAGAFQSTFEKISSWVAFALLAFLGGKMLIDCILEKKKERENADADERADDGCACESKTTIVKLLAQAVATSIDALAVGVTLRMTEISGGLPMGVWLSAGLIGVITLGLSVGAVYIGKAVGNKLADKATLCGGVVLILLAIKMLFV